MMNKTHSVPQTSILLIFLLSMWRINICFLTFYSVLVHNNNLLNLIFSLFSTPSYGSDFYTVNSTFLVNVFLRPLLLPTETSMSVTFVSRSPTRLTSGPRKSLGGLTTRLNRYLLLCFSSLYSNSVSPTPVHDFSKPMNMFKP